MRGSPRVTSWTLRKEGRSVMRQKRKEVHASVPARNENESPGRSARTSHWFAEIGRRQLASNKLARLTPKKSGGE